MESLDSFFSYCDGISVAYSHFLLGETDPIWTVHKQTLYQNGVIQGLYREQDNRLFSLISQRCDHKELIDLLQYAELEIIRVLEKTGTSRCPRPIDEPLINWIADYADRFAYPMCNTKEELLAHASPERVLSYVYICLSYKRWEKMLNKKSGYNGEQPNIDALYKNIFDKSSVFGTWGLIPVDETRKLYSANNSVRVYDSSLNKTIFIRMKGRFAGVLNELKAHACINAMAVRGKDSCIYDGENHCDVFLEEVERGQVFSWEMDLLPKFTRLYNKDFYDDCLWVKSEGKDITFEELCDSFCIDGDNVVTQMIHLQHDGDVISHIDHEYIFYDIESYKVRKLNPNVKGEAKKRVKTFKIDNSRIPMNYLCKINKDDAEISVPFIFFALDNYFEHKDLLEEYFRKIM